MVSPNAAALLDMIDRWQAEHRLEGRGIYDGDIQHRHRDADTILVAIARLQPFIDRSGKIAQFLEDFEQMVKWYA